jgi:hypothetical protein
MSFLFRSGSHGLRRLPDGSDDAVISAAAADVAFEPLLYFRFRGRSILSKKRYALKDHTGSAIPALHGIAVKERLLNRVETLAVGQTFDGRDLLTGNGAGGGQAGPMGNAIDKDRTGAALAFAAAVFSASQI